MADGDAPPSAPKVYDFSHIRFALNEAAPVNQEDEDIDEQLPTVTEAALIRRFLLLGTTHPVYYASGLQLTCKTTTVLSDLIKQGKGALILEAVLKQSSWIDPSPRFFAFALCARAKFFKRGDLSEGPAEKYNEYLEALQKAALDNVINVVKQPKQLFMFMSHAKHIMKEANPKASWDTAIAKAVANWFYEFNVQVFATLMTIRKLHGFTNRDLLRLAHVNANKTGEKALLYDHLFHYAVHNTLDMKKNDADYKPPNKRKRRYEVTDGAISIAMENPGFKLLRAHMDFCELPIDEDHLDDAVAMIRKSNFKEEQVPLGWLSFPDIWYQLFSALRAVPNILKMAGLRLLDDDPCENFINCVARNIADEDRIHPLALTLIADQYNTGRNLKRTQAWKPNPVISDALKHTYETCFISVQPPTDLRYLLVLDVSAAMNRTIKNTSTTARSAEAVLAHVYLQTEAAVETVYFGKGNVITDAELDNTMNLDQIVEKMEGLAPNSAKRVNGAAPMEWALAQKKEFDVFIVFIKNGQTARDVSKALKIYRKEMNLPKAKLITMDVLSKKLDIADGYDTGMLDIVGLNQKVPEVIKSFAMDKI